MCLFVVIITVYHFVVANTCTTAAALFWLLDLIEMPAVLMSIFKTHGRDVYTQLQGIIKKNEQKNN